MKLKITGINKIRLKSLLSLTANILNALLTAAAVGWFFTSEGIKSGAGNMRSGGILCLTFFTVDSNILAALCGLLLVPFDIKALKSGKNEIPAWALLIKLIGTTAVTVTFTVVLFFLGPQMGYAAMFDGNCLPLHLTCPIIAILSFCFCEQGAVITKKQALLGVIPTLIYATVYLINVIFTGVWSDFYRFNIGGFWYISYAVMLAVTYGLALALSAIRNKNEKSKKEVIKYGRN